MGNAGYLPRSMLSQKAYEALKDRIINLDLRPGERLNLDRLAQDFGISHTPLREALSRLAAENLVRVQPYKGFSVEPLLDEDALRNLLDMRALLEIHAVEDGIGNFSRERLAALVREIRVMDELVATKPFDVRGFNAADARLHEALVAAADNPILEQAYRSLNVHVQIARLYTGRGVGDSREANREHRRVVHALRAGDKDRAHEQVRSHISAVLERLLRAGAVGAREATA